MKALYTSLRHYVVQKLTVSNKEAIRYILSGRVLVNGQTGTLTQVLLPDDEVKLDDQVIKTPRETVYIAYHKPAGIESTMNAAVQNNLMQALDLNQRVVPVGRLDKASEGLMLLTNDGELVYDILHAEKHQEKEYEVTVDKPLTPQALSCLAAGIVIMGKKTRPAVVVGVNDHTFKIILMQGLNRQIRRMCYKLGYEVKKLVRIRIMTIELGNLARGEWRYLQPSEIRGLIQKITDE
ncbi:pseudouridine synthase [Pontibacter chitinilyticus]|uniref:pseudouridine synthase n=1 Tax=Pontibacter chitinilyticus TaxID=2674989 RepID=UPI003219FC7D